MNAATRQAAEIMESLESNEQGLALAFLEQLAAMQNERRKERNDEYLAKIRRGIKQCSEGRGIVRDIVEDGDG